MYVHLVKQPPITLWEFKQYFPWNMEVVRGLLCFAEVWGRSILIKSFIITDGHV